MPTKIKSAFKAIQPTKPVTPVKTAKLSDGSKVSSIVPIDLYVEIVRRGDRDNFGWSYLTAPNTKRAIVLVLNAETWLVDEAITRGDYRLIAFLCGSLLFERLARSPQGHVLREVLSWLRKELVPEPVATEFSWLAMRLVNHPNFGALIGGLAVGVPYRVATLEVPLSTGAAAQPWKPFFDKRS